MGILGVMFLILFTLKLLGLIHVSWWIVAAPLWAGLVVGLFFGFVIGCIKAILDN